MKLTPLLTISALALGLTAHAQQPEIKVNLPAQSGSAPAAAAAPAAPTFSETQLAEELGWFVGKKVGLSELEFSKAEVEALLRGISAAAAGKDSPFPVDQVGPKMDEFMQKKQTAYMAKLKDKNMADNLAYFTKLKETNKNLVELPSGLRYETIKEGDGPTPKPTDTVKVHYTGTLIDGTVFDSSVQRGEPIEFPLDGVIPGWTEGLQKVKKGGKIKLYVPPHLGYGDNGNGSIPPGATLIFDVELLDVKPGAAPAAAAPAPAATEKK
jgi:FKBP-type peptidyl-prolyl cis-trans isomerase